MLRNYSRRLEIVLEEFFHPSHSIFNTRVYDSGIEQATILGKCQSAINFLELHELNLQGDLSSLHSKIIASSEKLYKDGHYREAIIAAFALLIEEVKARYPIKDGKNRQIDGRPLMEQVFAPSDSKHFLNVNDLECKEGLKMLYAGSVAAIRNKYVHKTEQIVDRDYALNLLHYASALLRLFENPEIY
jgi:uncharacterized protein (TIGR02391 family)